MTNYENDKEKKEKNSYEPDYYITGMLMEGILSSTPTKDNVAGSSISSAEAEISNVSANTVDVFDDKDLGANMVATSNLTDEVVETDNLENAESGAELLNESGSDLDTGVVDADITNADISGVDGEGIDVDPDVAEGFVEGVNHIVEAIGDGIGDVVEAIGSLFDGL